MPFDYDYTSVKEYETLEAGDYQFETISAEETVSKSGKDMLVIKIKVITNDGREQVMTSNITQSFLFHLKNYWESVGHPQEFERQSISGIDSISFIGKCGMVRTVIKDGYSNIKGFLTDHSGNAESKKVDSESFEDEIPF